MNGKCLICMLGLMMLMMSIEGQIDRRFFSKKNSNKMKSDSFDNDNDEDEVTPHRDDQSLSRLFKKFLSKNSNQEQEHSSNSFSKLNLLKSFLSSLDDDKNGKLNKLFQLLNHSTADKDIDSSSSSKINRLLGLFKNQDSSSSSSFNKLELAMKLLNLSQGKASLSTFNLDELKSLAKFAG